jgi:hypothetical protein
MCHFSMSNTVDWSVSIAGECMVIRPFSMHAETEFHEVRELFGNSDVAYAHLEMNFGEPAALYPGRGDWYGSYMLADPGIARDLRWLGVDALATLTPDRQPLRPGLDGPSETWWSSAVINVQLTDGRLTGVTLHPVELGREVSKEAKITRQTGKSVEHPLTDGRPLIADQNNGARVLERYQRLSAEYDTPIEIDGRVGIPRIED